MTRQAEDLTGRTFGKLIVRERGPNMGHRPQWICTCWCGELTTVRADNLKAGKTRSCGACDAAHATGIEGGIRFRIRAYGGGYVVGNSIWCWGQAFDAATGALVYRSNSPRMRARNKGEEHTAASRVLHELAGMGLIGYQNGRTFKRWALEEGCVIMATVGSKEDTDEAWYEATGETPPERVHRETPNTDPNPLTPEQQRQQDENLRGLFQSWGAID